MKNAVFWHIKKVRTSQDTHCLSATEPNQLMLCKILGFDGGGYEIFCLLCCGAL
jgi:hypothetical protein